MKIIRFAVAAALFVFIWFFSNLGHSDYVNMPKQGTYVCPTAPIAINFDPVNEDMVTIDGAPEIGHIDHGSRLHTEETKLLAGFHWNERADCIYLSNIKNFRYTEKDYLILYGPEGNPGVIRAGDFLYGFFGVALLISPLLKLWILKKRRIDASSEADLRLRPASLLADVPLWIAVAGLSVGGYLLDRSAPQRLCAYIAIYKICRYLWLSGRQLSWEQGALRRKYLGRRRLYKPADIWFVRYRKSPIPGWSALEVGIPGGKTMRFEEAYFPGAEAFYQTLLSWKQ